MRETSTTPLVVWSRGFPAVPEQVRDARQFLATILDGRSEADDALLCLSELVTNAIVHSKSGKPAGQIAVRAQLHGSHLRVEVTDQGGPWTAHLSDPAGLHGRGLVILSRLVDAWGRIGNPTTGWTVWFEMTCAPIAPRLASPEGTAQRWTVVLKGDTLRRLRHKYGLSQEQLAAKAGLSPTTVARLERTPLSTCRSRTLARLAAAVGEPPATLTAEAANVAAAFDQVEMDFDPDGGFRYGGGRDLSKLEEQARAGVDRASSVDT
jgi:serine/threonine-protein kinase RsbW